MPAAKRVVCSECDFSCLDHVLQPVVVFHLVEIEAQVIHRIDKCSRTDCSRMVCVERFAPVDINRAVYIEYLGRLLAGIEFCLTDFSEISVRFAFHHVEIRVASAWTDTENCKGLTIAGYLFETSLDVFLGAHRGADIKIHDVVVSVSASALHVFHRVLDGVDFAAMVIGKICRTPVVGRQSPFLRCGDDLVAVCGKNDVGFMSGGKFFCRRYGICYERFSAHGPYVLPGNTL